MSKKQRRPVPYGDIAQANGKEIAQKAGVDFDIPSQSDPEFDKFIKFASAAPGSAERLEIIGADGATTVEKPAEAPLETVVNPPAPVDESKTPEQLRAEIAELNAKMVEAVNTHRSANGRLGDKNKELQRQLDAATAERESLRARLSGAAPAPIKLVDRPKPPKAPKPSDFGNDTMDDRYIAAQNEFSEQYSAWFEADSKWLDEMSRSTHNAAEARAVKIAEESLSPFRKMEEQQAAERQEQTKQSAWDSMWGEVSSMQSRLSLVTTRPMNEIDDQANIIRNLEPRLADLQPDEKIQYDAAKRYWDSLPESDRVAHREIVPIVLDYYQFEDGMPSPRGSYRTLEGFLHDTGRQALLEKSQAPAPVPALTQAQRAEQLLSQQQQSVSAMSAGSLSSAPSGLQALPNDADKKRLNELLGMREKNMPAFMKDTALVNEFKELKAKYWR